ncbi:HVO_A0114 family putative DNA-binding protein [Halonotius pteroides]|uniref:Transcriptional regulator n=1 Tax=Halonotius pteroides TaxID=268735 RepID=A0A3A6PW73_9EURY|nr:transcriptional regulator [Halonotius pteroides]RJX47724.1 transcriptional regulator [Halonotius pteroides]
MTENTLKITFQQAEEHRQAARERLRRAEAGETGEVIEQDVRSIVNFEDFDDIALLMRTANLRLIETIVSEEPASIRQLAEAVERDYREVHRNLTELESLGVIEFNENGSSKQPILRDGAKNIDFSIRFPQSVDHGSVSGASA